MVLQKKNTINFLLIFLLAVSVGSCDGSQRGLSTVSIDTAQLPDMHTENATAFISDSGITRYRIEAKVWDMYSINTDEPYTYFPEGFYMERFDSLLNIELIIKADTVYHYSNKDLWHAINNVFIQNQEGSTLETSELFYNAKAVTDSKEAIYTDKFARMTEGTRVQTGDGGFKSNASLTSWVIYKSGLEIEYKENQLSMEEDSLSTKKENPPLPQKENSPQTEKENLELMKKEHLVPMEKEQLPAREK